MTVISLEAYRTARAIPMEAPGKPVIEGSVFRGLAYAMPPVLLFWAAFAALGWALGLMS